MSDDGKNMTGMVRELRSLCERIALLLRTADALMRDEGWETISGNAFGGLQYTLAKPRGWIPQDFFRIYKNNNLEHISPFVSTVLDDWKNEDNLEEPLLTAGWFDYGPWKRMGNTFDYSWFHWHLKMPGRNDEGKLILADAKAWPRQSFAHVATLGVPLTSIVDPESLKRTVIEPLIQGINESQK